MNLKNRDFLKLSDFSPNEIRDLLKLAKRLKNEKRAGSLSSRLAGKNIALIFEKTSTRTRCAFEVAAFDEGACVTFLDSAGSQIGHKESIADTARVLSRMYDAIQHRGFAHDNVEALAKFATVPVYNGLSDEFHPTQMLADLLTMHEKSGKDYADISYAYVGDARFNMGNSLLLAGALMGADVRIAAPESLMPQRHIVKQAQRIANSTGAKILLTNDPKKALTGAEFVHTDVWVSMGENEAVWAERIELLKPYRVDKNLMQQAAAGASFMHCLPAFHNQETKVGRWVFERFGLDGVEVTNEVFESGASLVFDQAENRLHTIKAMLLATLAPETL